MLLLLLCLISSANAFFEVAYEHGVASGDPHADSIILWTKVTPRDTSLSKYVEIEVQVSKDSLEFEEPEEEVEEDEKKGKVIGYRVLTSADVFYTVKVRITGLKSQTQYYYRFITLGGSGYSPTGAFKLPPKSGESLSNLRYGVFSCSNWGWGYFNAYDFARQNQLDFWVHLGDYIYDEGNDNYPNREEAVRWAKQPGTEPAGCTTKGKANREDCTTWYRQRWSKYHEDRALQSIRAAAPLLAVWDDHEVGDNWYKDGIPFQTDEIKERQIAALTVYHEWQPTEINYLPMQGEVGNMSTIKRWGGNTNTEDILAYLEMVNRVFDFGDLLSIVFLETRGKVRTKQKLTTQQLLQDLTPLLNSTAPSDWKSTKAVDDGLKAIAKKYAALAWNDEGELIGEKQINWMKDAIQKTKDKTKWKIIAQQTNMQNRAPEDFFNILHDIPSDPYLATHNTVEWEDIIEQVTEACTGNYTLFGHEATLYDSTSKTAPLDWQVCLLARIFRAAGVYKIMTDFDSWAGYLHERSKFLAVLKELAEPNTIVYSGDIHNFYGGVLREADMSESTSWFNAVRKSPILTFEYGSSSVTSPGLEYTAKMIPPPIIGRAFMAGSRYTMAYTNTTERGFLLVDLDHSSHAGTYWMVSSVATQDYKMYCDAVVTVDSKGSFKSRQKQQDRTAMKVDFCYDKQVRFIPYCMGLSCPDGPQGAPFPEPSINKAFIIAAFALGLAAAVLGAMLFMQHINFQRDRAALSMQSFSASPAVPEQLRRGESAKFISRDEKL